MGSSEEIVGRLRLGQFAKCVIESKFKGTERTETVGSSHGDFGFVVQTLHDAAGKQLLSVEIIENQFTVPA